MGPGTTAHQCVDACPLLPGALNLLAFRQARAKHEEGAELYVSADNVRNAMVALRMERLERDEPLLCFLRHEFMHLHDMVDPAFGYSPHLKLHGLNPTQQRITRERYRLLWDITIDGRLTGSGAVPPNTREQHEALFNRAFAFWPEEKRHRVFGTHWCDSAPHHENLLDLASDPRDLSHAPGPLPGGSCPLCQFPTFEWADVQSLPREILDALHAQYPHWIPEHGACKRCLEIYQLAGKFQLPATMVL